MVKEFISKIFSKKDVDTEAVVSEQSQYVRTEGGYNYYVNNIINELFSGDKFPGSFGPTKYYSFVDYWTLRKRSMQLFQENPYAKGLMRRLIRNEIGSGLNLESSPIADVIGLSDEDAQLWADQIEQSFNLWSKIDYICDYKHRRTLGEIASQCRMTALVSGDCLVVLRINPLTRLPYVDIIDGTYVQTPTLGVSTKNDVKHGVELDSKGRHVAYYIQKSDLDDYERIPAWGVKSGRRLAWLVYGSELRLDDVRGEPLLACMLYMLKELDRYRDSEQRAAVVNSLLPMFIKKDAIGIGTRVIDGGAVRKGSDDVIQTDGSTKKWNWNSMLPGTVPQTLAPGEEPVSFNTHRPNVNYATFEQAILNVLAWVSEVPPEILTLLFQSNFSASRQANNEFNMYLEYRSWKMGVDFYQPIFVEHTIQSVLLGQINAPGFIDAWWNESKWQVFGAWVNAEWTGMARPSVDINKDVDAAIKMIQNDLSTKDKQCRKLSGMSYKTILNKRKRELDAEKTVGLDEYKQPVSVPVVTNSNDDEDADTVVQ